MRGSGEGGEITDGEGDEQVEEPLLNLDRKVGE